MIQWKAKVHKSGTKVAIFQDDKLVKVVKASEETFKPAEASKFAQELLEELEYRCACDIDTSTDVIPKEGTVEEEPKKQDEKILEDYIEEPKGEKLPTNTEKCDDTKEKSEDVKVVEKEKEDDDEPSPVDDEDDDDKDDDEPLPVDDEAMKEIDPTKAMAKDKKIDELKRLATNLKGLLEKERNDRVIERRARRGLAIAKQMVANGNLDDDFEIIRTKIAEIVDLDDQEISILERNTAGINEFENDKEASCEARRQRRLARINTIAAEEAQHDGDVEEADKLDIVAAKHAEKAEKYEKIAAKMKEELSSKDKKDLKEMGYVAKKKDDDDDDDEPTPVDESQIEIEAKKKKVDKKKSLDKYIEEPKGDKLPAGVKTQSKLAKKIKELREKIADIRLSAEASEAMGDTKTADAHDAEADDFEKEVEQLEKEYTSKPEDDESQTEMSDITPEHEVNLPSEPTKTEAQIETESKKKKVVDEDDDDDEKQIETESKKKKVVDEDDDDEKQIETESKKKKVVDEDDDDEKQIETESKKKKVVDEDDDEKQIETESKKKKVEDDDDEKQIETESKKKRKREGDEDADEEKHASTMIEGFGFDKSASVVEQTDYSNDSEVAGLEQLWSGRPKD